MHHSEPCQMCQRESSWFVFSLRCEHKNMTHLDWSLDSHALLSLILLETSWVLTRLVYANSYYMLPTNRVSTSKTFSLQLNVYQCFLTCGSVLQWLRLQATKDYWGKLWNSVTREWLQEVAGQVKSIYNPHWSIRWPVCKCSPFTLRAPEKGVAFCYNQHNSKGTSHLSQFHYCLTCRVFVFQTVGNQVNLLVAKTTAKRFSLLYYKPFSTNFT